MQTRTQYIVKARKKIMWTIIENEETQELTNIKLTLLKTIYHYEIMVKNGIIFGRKISN